ncbi:MAG: type IV pilus assembly protein PilM [Armatimonadota bacterium]
MRASTASGNYHTHRVGVDIGTHSVKGVEVVERGSELVICAAQAVSIPGLGDPREPPEVPAVVQALRALWAVGGFRTTKAVLALPAELVYMKWLYLEASNPAELDMTARAAAVRGAPFSPDDAVVDYRVLAPRGRRGRNLHFLMLVCASSSSIDALLDTAECAGLEPLGVDVGPLAATRGMGDCESRSSSLWSGQPRAYCIIGARSTTITVVRGGEPEFSRTVTVGGNDFTARIADQLSIDWAEAENVKLSKGARLLDNGLLVATMEDKEVRVSCENVVGRLAREIQRSLRFFSSQYSEGSYLGMVGSIVLAGGGALLKGLDISLERRGIEIKSIANPFAGFSVEARSGLQNVGDSAAQFAEAMGLAMGDYSAAEYGAEEGVSVA